MVRLLFLTVLLSFSFSSHGQTKVNWVKIYEINVGESFYEIFGGTNTVENFSVRGKIHRKAIVKRISPSGEVDFWNWAIDLSECRYGYGSVFLSKLNEDMTTVSTTSDFHVKFDLNKEKSKWTLFEVIADYLCTGEKRFILE